MRKLLVFFLTFAACITPPASSENNPNSDTNTDAGAEAGDLVGDVTDSDPDADLDASQDTLDVQNNDLPVLTGYRQVVAGGDHACALREDGRVVCWGNNSEHAVSPLNEPVLGPTFVSGVSDVISIAAGLGFSCALTRAGDVYCWGTNEFGQISGGGNVAEPNPRVAISATGAVELKAGGGHICLKVSDGISNGGDPLTCWGKNDTLQADHTRPEAQIVFPTAPSQSTDPIREFALGATNSCVRRPAAMGRSRCWGGNSRGESLQVGCDPCIPNGDTNITTSQMVQYDLGGEFGCGFNANGQVYCWGNDADERRGELTPTEVVNAVGGLSGDPGQMQIATGDRHACVIIGNETTCWGSPSVARGADSVELLVSVENDLGTAFSSITAGGGFTCAISQSEVFCWGQNAVGQLGRGGGLIDESTPMKIDEL